MTKAKIISFAEQFDPQLFHVDEAAAEESMFGGLVASGLHTLSLAIRLTIDSYLSEITNMAAEKWTNSGSTRRFGPVIRSPFVWNTREDAERQPLRSRIRRLRAPSPQRRWRRSNIGRLPQNLSPARV